MLVKQNALDIINEVVSRKNLRILVVMLDRIGDVVTAVLALALSSGSTFQEASILSNAAA